jgi:hypothetical protein
MRRYKCEIYENGKLVKVLKLNLSVGFGGGDAFELFDIKAASLGYNINQCNIFEYEYNEVSGDYQWLQLF